MELREALTQIAEIRQQLARTALFRGYRALPVAFSGVLAVTAGVFQHFFLAEPEESLPYYLILWIGAAVVSALVAGTEMVLRCRRSESPWTRDTTCLAIEQFLPCMIAGLMITMVIAFSARECAWLLPGIWQLLFSLGIFASFRLLPRATFAVGVFYLAAGVLTLSVARGGSSLSPWAMAAPFGLGQFLAAGILYWTLERYDGDSQEQ
jgi:uncharacterized membrane protein HdeD (DUF308 family)